MNRFILIVVALSIVVFLLSQGQPANHVQRAPSRHPAPRARFMPQPKPSMLPRTATRPTPKRAIAMLREHPTIVQANVYRPEGYAAFPPLTRRVLPQRRYRRCKRMFTQRKKRFVKLRYKSKGLTIAAVMGLPTHFSPQHRYPVMIFNLDGRLGLSRFHACVGLMLSKLFVSQGYILVVPQYRGVGGSEGMEQFGGDEVDDLLTLVKLLKKVPFVDPKNIFMGGGSRGGMMTYLALKHGAKINAALVYAGTVDLYRTIADFAWFEPAVLEKLIPHFQQHRAAEIQKRSVVHWPQKIHRPLCIVQGERDRRVPFGAVKKLVRKLRDLGKDVTFLHDRDGTHHNVYRRSHRAVMSWLRKQYKMGTQGAIAPKVGE